METAEKIFQTLAINGVKSLELIRESAYLPGTQKKLREWGITETSEMIGRSTNYIRQQEKSSKFPPSKIDPHSGRRTYSLAQINTLRDFFGTRPAKAEKEVTAIIAFANFKGGAAKTTSAVNSAQYFAKKGYKVLFIDCDSQASATQIFGYTPDEDISENETLLPYLIGKTNSLNSIIRTTYWPGLDLIPANLALYGAEFILPVKNAEAASLHNKFEFHNILQNGLQSIKEKYDLIILDCPPSMGMISINAIYAANSLVIPTPSAMLDFTSTVQFFSMLHETLARLPPKLYSFIRILITKHDGRASSDAIVTILRQIYGKYVMLNMMHNSEVIKKASANMQTIYEIDKYEGSKKTFDRACQHADILHNELESLIKKAWEADIGLTNKNETVRELLR